MTKSCFRPGTPSFLFLLLVLLPVHTLFGQHVNSYEKKGQITIASCQFPISEDLQSNATWIMKQMESAHDSGAHVLHFPECALTGYPGVDMQTMDYIDWDKLKTYTDSIMILAKRLKVWVILGSIHPLEEGYKPMNSLYVIDPNGKIAERYDKRFCTTGDLNYFCAGDHFSSIEINGVKCGLLICYDIRFPELYREYSKMDVDVVFQSFYNARQKPGGIHPKIMPVTAQARAATNHFYMSLTNSSAPSSWPCHMITPDGLIQSKLETDTSGILISEVDLSEKFYDASKAYREKALNGTLSSEKSPETARSKNRNSL
jgi:predicted amidohydrolase